MLKRLTSYKTHLHVTPFHPKPTAATMATFTAANLEPRGSSHYTRIVKTNFTIGEYRPTGLERMIYGRGSIEQLPSILNDLKVCKAFIVTGNSLYTKTPVIKHIEALLGDKHIKTFSKISQHAPVKAIREAAQEAKEEGVDVFISVGGGSPIDSVKGTTESSQSLYALGYGWMC